VRDSLRQLYCARVRDSDEIIRTYATDKVQLS